MCILSWGTLHATATMGATVGTAILWPWCMYVHAAIVVYGAYQCGRIIQFYPETTHLYAFVWLNLSRVALAASLHSLSLSRSSPSSLFLRTDFHPLVVLLHPLSRSLCPPFFFFQSPSSLSLSLSLCTTTLLFLFISPLFPPSSTPTRLAVSISPCRTKLKGVSVIRPVLSLHFYFRLLPVSRRDTASLSADLIPNVQAPPWRVARICQARVSASRSTAADVSPGTARDSIPPVLFISSCLEAIRHGSL